MPRGAALVRLRLSAGLWLAAGVHVLWPLIVGLGVLLTLAVWDIADQRLSTGVVTIAVCLCVYRAWRSPWPTRGQRDRALAQRSTMPHRPLRALEDQRALGDRNLWQRHQRRAQRRLARARLHPAPSSLARLDPMGVRHGLLLLAVLGVWQAQGDTPGRLLALWPQDRNRPVPLVDGVITPPTYTATPPVFLSTATGQTCVDVPAGSQLRVTTATAAMVRGTALSAPQRVHAQTAIPLRRSGHIRVGQWRQWADWCVRLVPDQRPAIRWAGDPRRGGRNSLILPVRIDDDHQGLTLTLRRASDGMALATPALPAPDRTGVRRVVADLSQSPLAGQSLLIRLEVTDAIGQMARTPTRRVEIPQPIFTTPLARSLIEIRDWISSTRAPYGRTPHAHTVVDWAGAAMAWPAAQGRLAHAPSSIRKAAVALDALATAPTEITTDPVLVIGLRHAASLLEQARSTPEARQQVALLNGLAQRAELATQSDARRAFEAARAAYGAAIARNAGPEERAALLADLQTAFADLVTALAQEAKTGPADPAARAEATSLADLQALMQEAERRAAAGDLAGAQALLDLLGQMMAQLRIQPGDGSGAGRGQAAGDTFTPLLDRQRALADAVRRWLGFDPQAPAPDSQAAAQEALADQAHGLPGGDEAAQHMRAAAGLLRLGEAEAALDAQRQAGRALQQAAERARQQAARQRDPLSGALGGADPLGRRPSLDAGGTEVQAAERARRLRAVIEQRLSDPNLPPADRVWLQRLLQDF